MARVFTVLKGFNQGGGRDRYVGEQVREGKGLKPAECDRLLKAGYLKLLDAKELDAAAKKARDAAQEAKKKAKGGATSGAVAK